MHAGRAGEVGINSAPDVPGPVHRAVHDHSVAFRSRDRDCTAGRARCRSSIRWSARTSACSGRTAKSCCRWPMPSSPSCRRSTSRANCASVWKAIVPPIYDGTGQQAKEPETRVGSRASLEPPRAQPAASLMNFIAVAAGSLSASRADALRIDCFLPPADPPAALHAHKKTVLDFAQSPGENPKSVRFDPAPDKPTRLRVCGRQAMRTWSMPAAAWRRRGLRRHSGTRPPIASRPCRHAAANDLPHRRSSGRESL